MFPLCSCTLCTPCTGASCDDTELLQQLRVARDSVFMVIKQGILLNDSDTKRLSIDKILHDIFSDNNMVVSQRVKRTYTILLTFTLNVSINVITNVHSHTIIIMSFLRVQCCWANYNRNLGTKIVPVIKERQLEQTPKPSLQLTDVSISEVEVINNEFSKMMDNIEESTVNVR